MIDAQTALRLHLLEDSPFLTLLGGPYVYWPELPAEPAFEMPHKALTFRFNGGSADPQLPLHRPTINFRAYGSTAYEAYQVYRALHDRLVRVSNLIVVDEYDADTRVAFYNFREITPGQPLEEPQTKWPFVFCVWTPTVSTLPVA